APGNPSLPGRQNDQYRDGKLVPSLFYLLLLAGDAAAMETVAQNSSLQHQPREAPARGWLAPAVRQENLAVSHDQSPLTMPTGSVLVLTQPHSSPWRGLPCNPTEQSESTGSQNSAYLHHNL